MLVSFAVYVAASDDIFLTKQPSAAPKPQGNLTVRLKPHEDWTREICLGIFLAAYAINIYLGRRLNQHLALWWTTQIAQAGGILDCNFAQLGPRPSAQADGAILLRESMSLYKLYATGRRHVTSAEFVLALRQRQDLLAVLWALLAPSSDVFEIRLRLPESSPPLVALLARPAAQRSAAQAPEVKELTKSIDVPKLQGLSDFPSADQLVVRGESGASLSTLLDGSWWRCALAPAPWALLSRHFRSLKISGQGLSKEAVAEALSLAQSGGDAASSPGPSAVNEIVLTMHLPPMNEQGVGIVASALRLALGAADALGVAQLSPEAARRAQA
ncbi:hypothetical protein H632_c1345p0, partial [Helicosporidium sp. ATCC 50920]